MNILITGGAGFVGSNLAIYLKERYRDSQIYVLDNLKRRGSEFNLERLKESGIIFIHGDIRSIEDFFELRDKDINLLIECSAEPSVLAGYSGNPYYLVNTNLNGLINCLEFCKDVKSDIIFLSTSRVYPYDTINSIPVSENSTRFVWDKYDLNGFSSEFGISEEFPLNSPRTLYGATKLAGELFIQEYAQISGFRYTITRFGVIAGPWQFGKVDQGVFTLWIMHHYFKKNLKYIGFGGNGKQVRDLLHIDDLCGLIDLQIKNIDQFNGKIFNAGGGYNVSLSLLETTQICEEITGNRIDILKDNNERPGDIIIYITDNRNLTNKFKWSPKRSARDIIQDTFYWIKSNELKIKKLLN